MERARRHCIPTFTASSIVFAYDEKMIVVERVDQNRAMFRTIQQWTVTFAAARTNPLPIPGDMTLPAGQTVYTFNVPAETPLVKVNGAWYLETTPEGGVTSGTIPPAISEAFFGPNDDLWVRTTVAKEVTQPAVKTYAVKLSILKPRFDGVPSPIAGYREQALFFAGSGTDNIWKIALTQAIPATLGEYGELLLEFRLYDGATVVGQWQMPYLRQYMATNNAPVDAAAQKYLAILNDKTLTETQKLDAIGAMSDMNGALGRSTAWAGPHRRLRDHLHIDPGENSVNIHNEPDFAGRSRW
jgi:hypothetical protein